MLQCKSSGSVLKNAYKDCLVLVSDVMCLKHSNHDSVPCFMQHHVLAASTDPLAKAPGAGVIANNSIVPASANVEMTVMENAF